MSDKQNKENWVTIKVSSMSEIILSRNFSCITNFSIRLRNNLQYKPDQFPKSEKSRQEMKETFITANYFQLLNEQNSKSAQNEAGARHIAVEIL